MTTQYSVPLVSYVTANGAWFIGVSVFVATALSPTV